MDGLERYHKLLEKLIKDEIERATVALRDEMYANFQAIARIIDSNGDYIIDSEGNYLIAL